MVLPMRSFFLGCAGGFAVSIFIIMLLSACSLVEPAVYEETGVSLEEFNRWIKEEDVYD